MVRDPSRAGVTLLELLLVLALLAAGAALVPPSLRLQVRSQASFADSLISLATSTRRMAVGQGTPATLGISPATGAWFRSVGRTRLDQGRWSVSNGLLLGAEDRIELRFTPSGQVWGPSRLRLLQHGDTMTVVVDPWTGRLTLQ